MTTGVDHHEHVRDLTVGALLLTTGTDPDRLVRSLGSITAQATSFDELIVVWNGVPAGTLPPTAPQVTNLEPGANLGIPEGRNHAATNSTSDILVFLDDDASLAMDDLPAAIRAAFEGDVRLAVVGMRIEDPATGVVLRRWVPRVGGDADTSGPVTRFPGGACAIRKEVWEQVGGFQGNFFYGHEETEFALRVLDAGWSIVYDPALVVHHPTVGGPATPERLRMLARNRVWLARLRLPWLVALPNIAVWWAITTVRSRSWAQLRSSWAGFVDGVRRSPGERRPVSWDTIKRLYRMGTFPFV